MEYHMKLDHLPQDCITSILSFTSPRDALNSSLVSSVVRAAVESDLLWESFLPSDYQEILLRSVFPVLFRSKKELFLRLCRPLLIDGGEKSFSIERGTNKKCYMLSARKLSITWSTNSLYWSWKPLLQSRFREVAELITITWLEIHGKMNTKMLSPNTRYGAYLVANFADRAYGLDYVPSEASVEVGNYQSWGSVCLRRQTRRRESPKHVLTRQRDIKGVERFPQEREDGWLEIELGEFYSDGRDEEVKVSLKEVKGEHLKGGLIVEGIELRPKW
ncbi:F-box protein like [Actinidia chinensis var. chinensis]|uniref:F-box protein like n=1 Tax=Actinidia chinensis var. chinensis TaxID=1590841 RepID=A0A2R6Q6Z7_ACTCC|nr:F-box protein like [Actinidia chinensis var. chinensis]